MQEMSDHEDERRNLENEYNRRRLKRISLLISLISVIAAGIAVALFVNQNIMRSRDQSVSETKFLIDMLNSITDKKITEEKVRLTEDYRKLLTKLSMEMEKRPSRSKVDLKIDTLDSSIKNIDKRLKNIETAIMQNPVKALEVPMIRKDLDVYKESYQAENLALRREMERLYDLFKWFFGIMLTMIGSILTLALMNFMRSRNQNE